MKKKLTRKQTIFINTYRMNGGNGVQACREAGYKGNDNTLAQVAAENLRKPYIAEEIRRLDAKTLNSKMLSNEQIREKLAEIATKEDARDSDRIQALDKLAKIGGMYTEKLELKGGLDVATVLKKARERAEKH